MAQDPRVFEYCDAPLPFPPGQSPFHIKGRYEETGVAHTVRLGRVVITIDRAR